MRNFLLLPTKAVWGINCGEYLRDFANNLKDRKCLSMEREINLWSVILVWEQHRNRVCTSYAMWNGSFDQVKFSCKLKCTTARTVNHLSFYFKDSTKNIKKRIYRVFFNKVISWIKVSAGISMFYNWITYELPLIHKWIVFEANCRNGTWNAML